MTIKYGWSRIVATCFRDTRRFSVSDILMINCSCGEKTTDYEAWVTHVRENMPAPPRSRKPNYRRQLKERITLVDYIDRHRILENDNLEIPFKEESI